MKNAQVFPSVIQIRLDVTLVAQSYLFQVSTHSRQSCFVASGKKRSLSAALSNLASEAPASATNYTDKKVIYTFIHMTSYTLFLINYMLI